MAPDEPMRRSRIEEQSLRRRSGGPWGSSSGIVLTQSIGSIGSRGSEGSRGFCSGGSFRFVGSFGFLGSLRLLCPLGLDVRRRRGSSFGVLAVFRYAIRPVAAFEARLHSRCNGMIWVSVKYPRSTPSRKHSSVSGRVLCVHRDAGVHARRHSMCAGL